MKNIAQKSTVQEGKLAPPLLSPFPKKSLNIKQSLLVLLQSNLSAFFQNPRKPEDIYLLVQIYEHLHAQLDIDKTLLFQGLQTNVHAQLFIHLVNYIVDIKNRLSSAVDLAETDKFLVTKGERVFYGLSNDYILVGSAEIEIDKLFGGREVLSSKSYLVEEVDFRVWLSHKIAADHRTTLSA